MKTQRWSALAALAALMPSPTSVQGAGQGQPPQLTPIDQLVVYAIDAHAFELLRYNFDTDVYVRVGVVTDQNGNVVSDIDSLAMIPHGPFKGLYGTANFYGILPSRLVKISQLDATAFLYPAGIGFRNVEGLVAAEDPDTSVWSLIGASRWSGLITIDPGTGAGSLLMTTEESYRGLSLAPDGTLYGVAGDELYTIDLETGEEDEVEDLTDDARYGALEHAFGDFEPRIKVPSGGGNPVVPDSWTQGGIMFAFNVSDNRLEIVNPGNGKRITWACSLASIDCQGLAFTTRLRDPYWSIVKGSTD